MKTTRTSALLFALTLVGVSIMGLSAITGCDEVKDAVEESIDGEAAALKEPDMPNCSRVVNCCAKLATYSATPEEINTACTDSINPAADGLIDTYQTARDNVMRDSSLTDETRASLLEELKTTYQEQVEPSCRCFLDETVNDATGDGFLSPSDCEFVPEVGELPEGATCEDAQGSLVNLAENPPMVEN